MKNYVFIIILVFSCSQLKEYDQIPNDFGDIDCNKLIDLYNLKNPLLDSVFSFEDSVISMILWNSRNKLDILNNAKTNPFISSAECDLDTNIVDLLFSNGNRGLFSIDTTDIFNDNFNNLSKKAQIANIITTKNQSSDIIDSAILIFPLSANPFEMLPGTALDVTILKNNLKSELEKHFKVLEYGPGQDSIEVYKNIGNFKIVYIVTHGYANYSYYSMQTSISWRNYYMNLRNRYSEDENSRRIIYIGKIDKDSYEALPSNNFDTKTKAVMEIINNAKVGLSEEFFIKYYKSNKKPIIILNTCYSMFNKNFQEISFIQNGAQIVTGWDNPTYTDYFKKFNQYVLFPLINGSKGSVLTEFVKIGKYNTANFNFTYKNPLDSVLNYCLFQNSGNLPVQISSYFSKENIDTLKKLGLTFNTGRNPPSLQGIFNISPCVLLNSNIKNDPPAGYQFNDGFFCFLNQKSDLSISFKMFESDTSTSSTGSGGFIFGSNDSFTICLNESGTSKENSGNTISYKAATVISGIKSGNNIKNLKYGFIITDKQNDVHNSLMKVGECRIIKDEDSLSELLSNDTAFSSIKPIQLNWATHKPLDLIVTSQYGMSEQIQPEVIASSDWNGLIFMPKYGEKILYFKNKNILWIDFQYLIRNYSISYKFAPGVQLSFKPTWARLFQSKAIVGQYSITDVPFKSAGKNYFAQLDSIAITTDESYGSFQAVLEIQLPPNVNTCYQILLIEANNMSAFDKWYTQNTASTFIDSYKSGTKYTIPGISCDMITITSPSCQVGLNKTQLINSLWQYLEKFSKVFNESM
jgi:hypothetical protein